jgi:hypothetical protein
MMVVRFPDLNDGVLGFAWGAPALLWWLCLAAAPIIIHLLSKRRHRETEWAAMRFLLEALRKNSRRLRIEQLVLLAVRALILILVVLALAQLLLDDLGGFFRPRQPVHKVIVIDASASMGLVARDETLFERARQTARAVVEQGRPGDVFNLVRLSNLPPAVIVPNLAYEPAKVVEEIEQMQLPHGTADVPVCLEKIADLLKLAPEVPQKEVVFISDFQRTSWSGGPGEDAGRIKGLLKQIDVAASVVLVDVGQLEAANVAVTSLESLESFVTPARPAALRAMIRNFGTERVTGRQLELVVDDKVVEQRAFDLTAGAETSESFAVPFAYGGERRVQLRLQKDAFPLDDQRWLVVPVKDRIRVLCVNGGNARSATGKATDYLELALAPGGSAVRTGKGAADRSRIEPTVISEGELQGFDLAGYDCVFFCNVRRFTEREAQVIETYLQAGGGVVWCLGDHVSADNYDQVLFRQGAGCLPARLGDRQGDSEKRETAFQFDPQDFSHPIVAAFQGNPEAGLERTQTYAYIQATLPAGNNSRVALNFDTGDPAIAERAFGRGRSILVTTSVDEQWGTWPLWPSFLPLVHEIVHYAVSGRWGDRQKLVGEPLTEVFAATAVDIDVGVDSPDGQTHLAHVVREESFSQFSYEQTGESGVYSVNFAHPVARSELFAVNIDPRESNLAKLVQDELAGELLAGIDFSYLTNWPGEDTAPDSAPAVQHGGLSRWLLYVLLYLMFTEQLLAWDFHKGLWLLCPLVPPVLWLIRKGA